MAWIDIKGHKKEINFLIESLRKKRLANSLLFLGLEGIGKKIVAIEFAKFLLCKAPIQENACDKCSSCIQVKLNSHPDLHIITGDSLDWIKIDQIREFHAKMYISAYNSKHKVFIIDNAHMLTLEAANSLLKAMEEPPLNTVIILITNKIDSCPETIVSRCQRIYFSPLNSQDIEEILKQKAKPEQKLMHFLSRFSQGSPGEAISLLKYKDIEADKNRLIELIINKNNLNINDFSLQLDKQYLERLIGSLISIFRDVLLINAVSEKDLLINIDGQKNLRFLAEHMRFLDIQESLIDLFKAQELNRSNANSKILLTWIIDRLKERVGVTYA